MRAADRKSTRRAVHTRDVLPEAPSGGMTGLGDFAHSGYTVEGHIERMGAFAAGARRKGGWARVVIIFLALLVVAPLAIGLLNLVLR